MKIKFENINKEQLEEVRKLIDEILSIDFKEMELTEGNLQKAKQIKDKSNKIFLLQYSIRPINIKIVSSSDVELTEIK